MLSLSFLLYNSKSRAASRFQIRKRLDFSFFAIYDVATHGQRFRQQQCDSLTQILTQVCAKAHGSSR